MASLTRTIRRNILRKRIERKARTGFINRYQRHELFKQMEKGGRSDA